jgi:hypothetical protein
MNDSLQQLISYITQAKQAGMTPDAIRQQLTQNNWDPHMVQTAMTSVEQAMPAPTQPMQQSVPSQATQPQMQQNMQQQPQNMANMTPPKYTLRQSFKDVVKGIKGNPVSFAVSGLVAIVGYAVVTVGIIVLVKIILESIGIKNDVATTAISRDTAGKAIAGIIVGGVVAAILSAIIGAFWFAASAKALSSGLSGKRTTPSETVLFGLKNIGRVLLVNLLLIAVIAGPGLGFVLLGLVTKVFIFYPLAILVSVIWFILCILRYALTQQVAVFEPEIGVKKSLSRSKFLMEHGGQKFLVFLIGILIVVSIALSPLTNKSVETTTTTGGAKLSNGRTSLVVTTKSKKNETTPIGYVVSALTQMTVSTMLVTLYLNRQAVRGRSNE